MQTQPLECLYASRGVGTKASSKSLYAYLNSLQVKVYEAYRQLIEASGLVTATDIKNRVIGKEEKGIMLLEVIWLATIY